MGHLIWQSIEGLTTKGLDGGHQSSMGPERRGF
jgi:hypothetical protein